MEFRQLRSSVRIVDLGSVSRAAGALHVAQSATTRPIAKQCAAAGIGATILSWPSVEAEVAQRQLVAIEIARPAITRVAALCVLATAPRSRALDCVTQQTVAAIRDTVRRTPWRGVRYLGAE